MAKWETITYNFVSKALAKLITFVGLDVFKYKCHSFRIGAATTALLQGHSIDEIQRMGRWNSNAIRNYIRIPSFYSQL